MKHRRLKVALLEDMNDPFELLGIEHKTPGECAFFQRGLKPEMNRTIGLLCFSLKWNSPVLWSHYADKHRGLCLGFDIPDQWAKKVMYVEQRLKAEIENSNFSDDTNSAGYKLITTKYRDWEYENEIRLIIPLESARYEDPNYFASYCKAFMLREIVVGVRSKITNQDLLASLSPEDADVSIIRSRLAPDSFQIIPETTNR